MHACKQTILVGVFLCLWLSACRRSTDDKLVGRWETHFGLADAGIAKATVTYAHDHSVVAVVEGRKVGTTAGTWRVDGDKIITKVKSSTIKQANEGKEFRETVVQLKDDVLVVKDSDQNVLTYKRLK
jgi:uncharacterized protein (TIGR03066 family)